MEKLIFIASVVAAALTIWGAVKGLSVGVSSIVKRMEQKRQEKESQATALLRLNSEMKLICKGVSAALDGLEQLGANHTVPKTRKMLDEYLNNQAHDQA